MLPDSTRTLITAIASGNYSEVELADFLQAVGTMDKPSFLEAYHLLYQEINQYPPENLSPGFKEAMERRLDEMDESDAATPGKLIPIKRNWRYYVAAAAVLLLLAFGADLYINRNKEKRKTANVQDVSAPAAIRATITLADGSKIILDSAHNGLLAQQGQTNIMKSDSGMLSYQLPTANSQLPTDPSTANSQLLTTNTLTNPRGSRVISLTLSDGTRIWLNVESSISYPVAFTGKERRVKITGEAYFDVRHNAQMPFRVEAGKQLIEDLGTEFNVSAYRDEPEIKTTLIQGKLEAGGKILKPGEQAVTATNGNTSVNNTVDLQEVLAWKDNLFDFESADLKTILRSFSRWYDVNVEYTGAVPADKYFVIIKRSGNLSDVLKALRTTGIRFRIEGKKLIVGADK